MKLELVGTSSLVSAFKTNFSLPYCFPFFFRSFSPPLMVSLERGIVSKKVEILVILDLHCFLSQKSPSVLNISE